MDGSWKASNLSGLYFGYWDECVHCEWFIHSLPGAHILGIKVVSKKKV